MSVYTGILVDYLLGWGRPSTCPAGHVIIAEPLSPKSPKTIISPKLRISSRRGTEQDRDRHARAHRCTS